MTNPNQINKTQRNIRKALLRLLSSYNLTHISTLQICEEAEVSRSSFYTYYNSKYDVVEQIEKELISGFLDIMLQLRATGKKAYYENINNNRIIYFTQYFQYIEVHFSEFKSLLGPKNETGFSERFAKAISKTRLATIKIWNSYPQVNSENDRIMLYREAALSSLYVCLFSSWCQQDMDLSVEKMASILNEIWKSFLCIGVV